MAPFAKSFGQAFSQSYDAESKRRRQKEDEIAQEERLEERMGRTRAYELGQELERENRSATRQLGAEERGRVDRLVRDKEVEVSDSRRRLAIAAETEALRVKQEERADQELGWKAASEVGSEYNLDLNAQNWKQQHEDFKAYKKYEADRAIYGLPKLPREGTPPLSKFADPLEEFDALGNPIEFGYKVGKPTDSQLAEIEKLSRDRLETVKDLASQRQIRESDQAFFREASSLVPLNYQGEVTDKDGNITKSGQAFLRSNVKMKDFTYFDQIKGKDVTERRLTFIRPVQEPGGTGEPAVEQPAPLPTPTGNPIGGPKKDTAVNAVVMKRMGDEGMSPSQASVIKKILGSDLPDVSGRYSDAADIAIDKNIAASRMAIAEERKMQSMESAPLRDDTRGSLGLTRRVVSPFQAPDVNGMWQQLPLPQIIPRTARQQVEMENRIMESRQKEEALQKKMYELQIYKNTLRPPSDRPWAQPYYTE